MSTRFLSGPKARRPKRGEDGTPTKPGSICCQGKVRRRTKGFPRRKTIQARPLKDQRPAVWGQRNQGVTWVGKLVEEM